MLKKRIIPVQLLLNNRLVKSIQFASFRDVGDPVASSKVYNSQFADELIFLNVARDNKTVEPLKQVLDKVSQVCFMPLAVGGGIRTYEDAEYLIRNGADKVVLNTACYSNQDLITKIANTFGTQAVVVCVDVHLNDETNNYELFSHCGQKKEICDLLEYLDLCVQSGAGEILIQSIDHDGKMNGFDIPLIKQAVERVNVPVIACGGAGNYYHLKEVFLETNVSAVACGSIFNFSDSNLIRAKAFLSNYSLPFKLV